MKKQLGFYIPYLIFVLTFSVLIFCNSKANLHLWLTSFNSPSADVFFHYYTYVGDWMPFAIAALLLFYNYRITLFVLISQLVCGIFSTTLKHIFNEPRPILYFQQHFPTIQLHQVVGEHLYTTHSFPSGHTISAFAFFFALTLYTQKSSLHFLFFVLAFLVGYSRIYLSQHFAVDVLTGSFVGILAVVSSQVLVDKFPLKWIDNSFFGLLKK
jgi:membrane-associated phospholipid phosphatase